MYLIVITPVIGLGFQFTAYRNINLILLNNYSISEGIQLFQKLTTMVNIGFLNTQHLIDGQNQKLKAILFSTSFQYMFLKKYWFSPSLRFDVGGMLWSNIKVQRLFTAQVFQVRHTNLIRLLKSNRQ